METWTGARLISGEATGDQSQQCQSRLDKMWAPEERGQSQGKHLCLLAKLDLQGLSGEQGAGAKLIFSITVGLSNIRGGGP